MGNRASAPSCESGSCLNRAGHYRQDYLRKRWKGTDREGYRYSVGHAPSGAATCMGCKQKIAKGELRVGRSQPNPFDAEGGATDFTKFAHVDHAFDVFLRSKCASRVPLSARDLAGFDALPAGDKRRVLAALRAFAAARRAKCGGGTEREGDGKKAP